MMSDQSKKALIVVDVQNDFCPGGSLAVAHGAEVVAPLNKLIGEFLDAGPVFRLAIGIRQDETLPGVWRYLAGSLCAGHTRL
jgi:hypothetical protein